MNSRKVIWYCHHYAGSPSQGMSYRPYYLTKYFRESGLDAYVVSASYHHLQQSSQSQSKAVVLCEHDGVPFISLKTVKYKENGLGRLINMWHYALQLYLHHKQIMAITGTPNVIIVSSAHPFHYPILERIARKCKAKLIFEVRDLWPLSLIELLNMSESNPFILWLARIERRAYANADVVVSLLENSLSYMQSKGLQPCKYHHIPNGTDLDTTDISRELPQDITKQINILKRDGTFLLGYAGTIGKPNAMSYLITAMMQIADTHPHIHCLIVGEGPLKTTLLAEVLRLNLKNVTFFSAIPKYTIPLFLSHMDALYLGWNDLELYQYGVSPNKLFDYMMAERPIIESGGLHPSLIKKFNCGLTCNAANSLSIANAIINANSLSPTTRREMGERGRQAVIAHYDYKILAARYMQLMDFWPP